MRTSMAHERGPADIPPRLAKILWAITGLASAALAGTVTVAVHCFSHG